MNSRINKCKKIKKYYERKWFQIKGVVAVGIGETIDKKIGIIISVNKNVKRIRQLIPLEIEGISIELKVTGEIKAL